MNNYISTAVLYSPSESYLAHHGIKGQKWGVRRYQNSDGSLTPAGERRYYGAARAIQKDIDSFKPIKNGVRNPKNGRLLLSKSDVDASVKGLQYAKAKAMAKGDARRAKDAAKIAKQDSPEHQARQAKIKKAVKIGAVAAGAALAAYGGYKLYQNRKDIKNKAAAAEMARKMRKGEDEYRKALEEFRAYMSPLDSRNFTSGYREFRMPDGSMRFMSFDKDSGSFASGVKLGGEEFKFGGYKPKH